MANYAEFKETIWSKAIELAIKKRCVLEAGCNTQYQGEVGLGKRVKVLGVARPTVSTYTPGTDINSPEKPADSYIYLDVDQYKYVNYMVDSIEAAQSDADIMGALTEGAADAITELRDAYVGGLAKDATQKSASLAISTEEDAAEAVDAALVALWTKGVRNSDDIRIECSPWFYDVLTNRIIALSTNNTGIIANGEVGKYKGAHVIMSNGIHNDATDDYIMVRTKKAIAFAGGIHRVIPYEPEKQFGDAIKILDTYGAKIARQDEIYVIKAHKA